MGKNEHKNEQKCCCNFRVFKIYLGQNKEKENHIKEELLYEQGFRDDPGKLDHGYVS